MQTFLTRYCLVAALAVGASGCYSGGRWTMPDLAFWKHTPFSSSDQLTDAPEATPTPSELAVEPGPAPGAGYTSSDESGGVATTLPSYPSTASNDAPAYTPNEPSGYAGQQPYPSAQAAAPTAGASAPYYQPQQGYYGAAPAQQTATAPVGYNAPSGQDNYAGTAPYNQAPGYGGPAAGGYAPADPAMSYGNPVRPSIPGGDRYGNYRAADTRAGAAYDYRDSTPRYGDPANQDTGPSYRSDARQSEQPDRYQDYRAGDYRSQPSGGQAPATAPGGQSYQPPAGSDYRPGATGYQPPVSDYRPGDTGYQPPGASSYQAPADSWNAPSSTSPTDDSGYRPGSVDRYQPQSFSSTSPATSAQGTRVDTSVVPVSYGAPVRR